MQRLTAGSICETVARTAADYSRYRFWILDASDLLTGGRRRSESRRRRSREAQEASFSGKTPSIDAFFLLMPPETVILGKLRGCCGVDFAPPLGSSARLLARRSRAKHFNTSGKLCRVRCSVADSCEGFCSF
jgi:hypothetical protein